MDFSQKLLQRPALLFLPYISIYLLFWFFEWPVSTLKEIFCCLHAVNLSFLARAFYRKRKSISRLDGVFWLTLFLCFLLPGAYLEFPSDTWEHFDRIFSWSHCNSIVEHGTRQRFAYFWGWTLLGDLPLGLRRFGLDLYGAFWQWSVCLYFYFLLRRLGFEKQVAMLQVVASVLFMGTGIFSFRYYALSSTPLAYVFYLQGLLLLLDGFEKSKSTLAWLPFLAVGIYFNHPQEGIFLALNGIAITVYFLTRKKKNWRFALFSLAGLLCVAAFFSPDPYTTFLRHVFAPGSRHLTTYGIPGLLGLLYAFGLYRQQPLFTLLSTLPILLLLWPPFALIAPHFIPDSEGTYRLLYAFPTCFAFALLVYRLCRNAALPAGLVLLVLSLPYFYPWLGRGVFQFYRAPAALELVWQNETIAWFRSRPKHYRHCTLVSDPVDSMGMRSSIDYFFYLPNGVETRRGTFSGTPGRGTEADFDAFVQKSHICGFLLVDPERSKSFVFPRSFIGRKSAHWSDHSVETAMKMPGEVYAYTETLLTKGWKKVSVPPFFNLWLRPAKDLDY